MMKSCLGAICNIFNFSNRKITGSHFENSRGQVFIPWYKHTYVYTFGILEKF